MTADYASGTMRAVDLVPPGLADEPSCAARRP